MVVLENFNKAVGQYGYNTKQMCDGLESVGRKISMIRERCDRLQGRRSFRIFREAGIMAVIDRFRKPSLERKKDELESVWKRKWGANAPYVLGDNGKEIHYRILMERIYRDGVRGDGWYHIPNELCPSDGAIRQRKDYEQQCRKAGIGIPEKIGRVLEAAFQEAQRSHKTLWIHRTGIAQDSGLLSDIAANGLIVNSQGAGEWGEPQLSYTATELNARSFPYLLKNIVFESYKGCRGIVLCQTSGEPVIKNNRLLPDQVIGYIGRDDRGRVNAFFSGEEMIRIHDKKEIRMDGVVWEIERKNLNQMRPHDYVTINSSLFHKPITFMNDCINPDSAYYSVSYDGIFYGNVQQMVHALRLNQEQEKELGLYNQFAHDEFCKESYKEFIQDMKPMVHPLDENGRLMGGDQGPGEVCLENGRCDGFDQYAARQGDFGIEYGEERA